MHEPHYTHAEVQRMRARAWYAAAAVASLLGMTLIVIGVMLKSSHLDGTWAFHPGLTCLGVASMLAVAGSNCAGHSSAATMRGIVLEQVAAEREQTATAHRETMTTLRELVTAITTLSVELGAAEDRVQGRVAGLDGYVRQRMADLADLAELAAAQAAAQAADAPPSRGQVRRLPGHHAPPLGRG